MKNILLANIWNRNIKYNWNFIEKIDNWFFDFTKMLYEDIENKKLNIKINIIDSILKNYNIEIIYLFATNQWHHQDTYYEAKIIEYLLKDKYNIIIIEKKDDPRKRDIAFKFFEDFFNENDFSEDNLIISWSWWVPAMKEALNFYSVIKYKNSKILDVDENNWDIFDSSVDKEYLKNIQKNTLYKMINSFDYNWALIFLWDSLIKSFELEQALKYVIYRFNFNFEQANNIYETIKNNDKLKFIEKIDNNDYKKIEKSLKKDDIMIKELIDNIEISYNKWEYSMVLWKIFRLNEAINRYFFEMNFKISTKKVNWKFEDFENFINNSEDIKIFCNNFINNWVIWLRYDSPNTKILSEINKNFIKNDELYSEWKKIDWWVNNLSNIRNNSIMAHWWKWAKKEDIKWLIQKLNNFKECKYWNTVNIFENINKNILEIDNHKI